MQIYAAFKFNPPWRAPNQSSIFIFTLKLQVPLSTSSEYRWKAQRSVWNWNVHCIVNVRMGWLYWTWCRDEGAYIGLRGQVVMDGVSYTLMLIPLSWYSRTLQCLHWTYLNLFWYNTHTPSLNIQGAPKKMHHSNLYPISVLEVRFYFFTCVLDSEFWARFIWTFKNAHSES